MRSMMDKYDSLKLENQLCFPLYAVSKEIIRRYKPFLDELDLTYTQYITMMVIWEEKCINVRDLGHRLYLDSGTLTPVLKKLEKKGYIARCRSTEDERSLNIYITEEGEALRDQALIIPQKMGGCISISQADFEAMYRTLYQMLDNFSEENEAEA